MKITKRNYWLLLAIIHFIILLFFYQDLVSTSMNNPLSGYGFLTFEEAFDIFGAQDNRVTAKFISLITLSFISIIAIIVIFLRIEKEKDAKYLIWIWGGLYGIFFITVAIRSEGFVHFDFVDDLVEKNQLGILLCGLFLPYLYLVIQYTVIGIETDITQLIHEKQEADLQNNLSKLSALKEAKILNEDEFQEKQKELLAKKIKKEFILSDDYKKLMELVKSGLYTKDEFEKKISEIVIKRVNDSLNKS